MLVPLAASLLQRLVWLILLVEEGLRQACHVGAVLEFGRRHLGGLVEVAVSVEELVNFVLNLSL